MADLKLYTIINPSDPMSLKAPSIEVAAAAVLFMNSGGKIGAEEWPNGEASTPLIFGWKEWLAEHGMGDFQAWMREHSEEVACALESVMLGRPGERSALDETLADLPEEVRAAFIAKRNDRIRSSLSDWESYAHERAVQVRAAAERAAANA